MWGLITSLNDILIPHLKALFALNYLEAMLIQFCFFGAYFVMSFPSGYLVERVGYRHGVVIGLSVAGIGCLGFYPAAAQHSYPLFLLSLFVLASGITLLQVAANPYVALLGDPHTAASRLNLTQAFNSLGTTVGPWVGAVLILSVTASGAAATQTLYLMLAAALFAIAVIFSRLRLPLISTAQPLREITTALRQQSIWRYRHLMLGALAIFVYVGAEVTIGSFLVNFLSAPDTGALPASRAGQYVSLYWGGAMVGRFLGSAILRRVRPGHLLAFNAACAVALLLVAMTARGATAMYAVLAVGLFNSIMFPTIFTLAVAHLGKHTGEGSGVLCMAIVGGAIVPVIAGYVADHSTIAFSFMIPALCYVYIVYYGLRGHVVH
jgi:FHS family L-fucose permease-like MFS transporter